MIALERLVLLTFALVATRHFGVEITEAFNVAKHEPDTAMALIAAAILLRVILGMTPSRAPDVGYEALHGTTVLEHSRSRRSPADIHRTAVHEAGHLLMFAAREVLPDDLHVKVFEEVGPFDAFRGHVRHVDDRPEVLTEQYLWWSMLMRLGGTEAERVVLGDRGDGAVGDNATWLRDATAYLANGFGGAFYPQPFGDDQRETNRVALNELKARCTELVHEFLSCNADLLTELGQLITAELTLSTEQIGPFLNRALGVGALALKHGTEATRWG